MKKLFQNNGTSLIEVLVSMIVITVTTIGGIALYINSSELEKMALHKKMATEIANSKMEEYRDADYSTLVVGTTQSDVTIGGLTITNGMTETITAPTSDYKQVQVTVNWNEVSKVKRNLNVNLITFVTP